MLKYHVLDTDKYGNRYAYETARRRDYASDKLENIVYAALRSNALLDRPVAHAAMRQVKLARSGHVNWLVIKVGPFGRTVTFARSEADLRESVS